MTIGFGTGLEGVKRRAQRAPFQFDDGGIIDDIACSQPRDGVAAFSESTALQFRQLLNVDIERIQKQPAVWRIRAAMGGAVIEQRMQWIEADAIRSQLAGEFDQPFEIGEIPDPPIARGADAVELYRQ